MKTLDQHQWKDSEGTTWSTIFKAVDVVRLRESAGLDLLDPKSMKVIFGTGPLKRIEILAELTRRQWEAKGKSYEEYSDLLLSTETSFVEATAALQKSISYFFLQLGRIDLATVCDRAWEAMVAQANDLAEVAGGEKVGKLLAKASAKGMAAVEAVLDRQLESMERGETSGLSLGSTEETGES